MELLSRMPSPILPLILAIFFLLFIAKRLFFSRRPPGTTKLPGPLNLPIIGRIHDVDPMRPWTKMAEFSKQYDGFFYTNIMGEDHLWLGNQKDVHELFAKRSTIYSARPEVPAVPGSNSQGQYLPLLSQGDHWRRQRRFAQTVLTAARAVDYYDHIYAEVPYLLNSLLETPASYYDHLDNFCGRITARLAYGSPDSFLDHVWNARRFITQISPCGPITNRLKFMGMMPEWVNPSKRAVRERREREEKLWIGLLEQARQEWVWGGAKTSYAKTYWERKAEEEGRGEKNNNMKGFGFNDREAAYAVGMLCTVAIFTISGPLNCFFLAMVLHPEWQDKVREEVDRVLGDRLATLSDSPNLPLVRAVIKECVRWRPPVPAGVPHVLVKDDIYNGYFIPKGTVVHPLEVAISRDEDLYPDPETYNPARWLDDSYPSFKAPLTEYPKLAGFHQFGVGRRTCPGVDLTEGEMLVACSAIVWAFELKPKKRADGSVQWPDPSHMSADLIGGPLPFEFDLVTRSEEKAARVRELWQSVQGKGF